jgi:ketosteroid isomerase-like protein
MTSTDDSFATLMQFYEAETAYLASETRDFSILAPTLDPEVEIHQPASLPYGGVWRGHDGFEAWMRAFGEQWAHLEVRDPQFHPAGDVIFSRSHVHAVARATGRAVDWPLLQFFRVRNGRIRELRPFHWDTAALLPAFEAGR